VQVQRTTPVVLVRAQRPTPAAVLCSLRMQWNRSAVSWANGKLSARAGAAHHAVVLVRAQRPTPAAVLCSLRMQWNRLAANKHGTGRKDLLKKKTLATYPTGYRDVRFGPCERPTRVPVPRLRPSRALCCTGVGDTH
jgi:hypothetical protein